MNTIESVPDISNSCRLCLDPEKNIRNIFYNDHQNWVEDDISEQILEATNIQVSVEDGPTGICRSCFRTVNAIIAFRRKCAKVNECLRTKYGAYHVSAPVSPKQSFTGFIDLGEECLLLPPKSPAQPFCDYEVPSPNFQYENSNCKDESTSTATPGIILKTEKIERPPLLKCRYKLKGGRPPRKLCDELPKLKKRDLMETKAYQGLCHLCGKEFQHLWVHLQSHSEVPTDTCDICGKGFKTKSNLQLHILLHKEAEIPCEICGKRYRTKMRLKRHMRVHTGDRPFSCNVCNKKFYTKYNVDVHMRMHTGEKPFICNYCSEQFSHSYALKNHLNKFHKGTR